LRLSGDDLRGQVAAKMNPYPLALDLKFRQAVLREECEEVAQFFHGEVRLRAARLALLLVTAATAATTPSPATLALIARRTRALLLLLGLRPGRLLRSLLACGLCCAFLIVHSFRLQAGARAKCTRPFLLTLNKAKSLNRAAGSSADGQLRLGAKATGRAVETS
jgi:hypothetical protein